MESGWRLPACGSVGGNTSPGLRGAGPSEVHEHVCLCLCVYMHVVRVTHASPRARVSVCVCAPAHIPSACLVRALWAYLAKAGNSRTEPANVPVLTGLTFQWERQKRTK